MIDSPQVYVCIVSDHNLPDLEAVLTFKPVAVVLLATARFAQAAQRLEQQILQVLPHCKVKVPMLPISGNSLVEAQRWAAEELAPKLQQLPNPQVLNLTGGTKALALAMLYAHPWQECHYKAFQSLHLERFTIVNGQPAPLTNKSLVAASIDQAVRLYCDISHEPHSPWARGLALARQLWEGLEQDDAGLLELFNVFSQVWVTGREHLPWKESMVYWPLATLTNAPAVTAWFEQLQELDPDSLYIKEQQLHFPGNRRHRRQRHARQWISGGWLEELVYYWLSEVIPERQLALNVRSQTNADNYSQREADILFLHKGVTWVMEIKADVPPGQSLSDMENQLSGNAERYGKTSKILFIGPQLTKKLHAEQKWESFTGRCRGNNVNVCASRQDLYNTLKVAQS